MLLHTQGESHVTHHQQSRAFGQGRNGPGDAVHPGGTAVTKLRLATDRYRKDAENETDWHNIVVWGATAEAVNQYVGTGQRIYLSGRLVQNSWEGDDGQRRHRTEVHASEVVFLDSKGGNGHGDAADIEQPVGTSPF